MNIPIPADLNFIHPSRFFILIPLTIILLFLVLKNFVKIEERSEFKRIMMLRRRRWTRLSIFILRLLILALLVVALAGPYAEIRTTTEGDRSIYILVDDSRSMEIYDDSFIDDVETELSKTLPVRKFSIASDMRSNIGDGILGNLGSDKNLLVFTDGNNNYGTDLRDVSLYAASLNATINVIATEASTDELAVRITGPSRVLSGSESEFTVLVSGVTKKESYHLTVKIDGQTIIDRDEIKKETIFSKSFKDGYHKIEALISIDDKYPNNNVFYKAVHVIPKTKVLFVSETESPMFQIFDQLYETDHASSIDRNLDGYYAVVLNDMPGSSMSNEQVQKLSSFLGEGNGLFVIGGRHSFEYGGYSSSPISSLLPVTSGQGTLEEKPDNNAVILIDVSPGDPKFETVPRAKAQALDLLDQFKKADNVGVVAFAENAFTISPMSKVYQKDMDQLKGKVSNIKAFPSESCTHPKTCSNIIEGISAAVSQLKGTSGKKFIFLLSDGQYFQYLDYMFQAINTLIDEKVEVHAAYTIKLDQGGSKFSFNAAELALKKLTSKTGGKFIKNDLSRIRFALGPPDKSQLEDDNGERGLVVYDDYHFITEEFTEEDKKPNANIYGYNKVIPKSNARLLITTSMGEPILTTWRFGLGRIAVLSTDDGIGWAPDMLNRDNSRLISRISNWAIGDPERKQDYYIQVSDTRVNSSARIEIRSSVLPVAEGLNFYKSGEDIYSSDIIAGTAGFHQVLNALYSVNRPKEYDDFGINQELINAIDSTGGKIFKPGEASDIVNHTLARSERVTVEKQKITLPFIAVALLFFLIDILIRKIQENKNV